MGFLSKSGFTFYSYREIKRQEKDSVNLCIAGVVASSGTEKEQGNLQAEPQRCEKERKTSAINLKPATKA